MHQIMWILQNGSNPRDCPSWAQQDVAVPALICDNPRLFLAFLFPSPRPSRCHHHGQLYSFAINQIITESVAVNAAPRNFHQHCSFSIRAKQESPAGGKNLQSTVTTLQYRQEKQHIKTCKLFYFLNIQSRKQKWPE